MPSPGSGSRRRRYCLHLISAWLTSETDIAFTSGSGSGARSETVLPSSVVQVEAHVGDGYCLHLLFEFMYLTDALTWFRFTFGDGITFTSSVHGSRRRRILPSHLVQVQAHVRRRYCLHLLFEFTWEYPVRKTATRSSNILPFITPATRT